MAWLQLSFPIEQNELDLISDFFEQNEALSITATAADSQEIFEPLPGEKKLWQKIQLSLLFASDVDHKQLMQTAEKTLKRIFDYEIQYMEDKDWQSEWKRYFKVQTFQSGSKSLQIIPSWKEADQDTLAESNTATLFLDPGLAFGTGSHETTALCLNWLTTQDLSNQKILDYGCGSGILALAANKLGGKTVDALDIDPQAIWATQSNAAKNNCKINTFLPQALPVSADYNVILANLIAEPLRQLKSELIARLKPGGLLVLSGILKDRQLTEIKTLYAQDLNIITTEEKNDWGLIVAQKPVNTH